MQVRYFYLQMTILSYDEVVVFPKIVYAPSQVTTTTAIMKVIVSHPGQV